MSGLARGIAVAIGVVGCVGCAESAPGRASAPVPVGFSPPPATPGATATPTPGSGSPPTTFEIIRATPLDPLIHQGESTQVDVQVRREGWDGPLRLTTYGSTLVDSTSWIPAGSGEGLITFVASTEGMPSFSGESEWVYASNGPESHDATFQIRIFPPHDTMMLGDVKLVAVSNGALAATIDSDDVLFLMAGTSSELTARRSSDGSLDPAFGNDGTVDLPAATESSSGMYGLVSDPRDRITALGRAGHDHHFRAVRVQHEGALDPAFGMNGVDDVGDVFGGSRTADANDPTGRLYVWIDGIRMIDADGAFDPTFGSVPYAPVLGDGGGAFFASATELDRRLPDGTLDPSFGDGGIVTWEWPSYLYNYETEFSSHSYPYPSTPAYDDAGDIVVPVSWTNMNGATLEVIARDGSRAQPLRDPSGNIVIVNGSPSLTPDGRGGLWIVAMLPIPDTPGPTGPRLFEVRHLGADGVIDEDRPRTYFWFNDTTDSRFLATRRVGSNLVVAFIAGSNTSWVGWVPLP